MRIIGLAMKPKVKVWVTFGDRLKFGDGRADLLELIEERGSLRAAAQVSGMSYRNAWGYLRELESVAGLLRKESAALIAHREKNGPCKKLEDLKKVAGLDYKKIDARKERLACK